MRDNLTPPPLPPASGALGHSSLAPFYLAFLPHLVLLSPAPTGELPTDRTGSRHHSLSCARPQSSHPPAVVPAFVLSEKQVLRFFGHLSEGKKD